MTSRETGEPREALWCDQETLEEFARENNIPWPIDTDEWRKEWGRPPELVPRVLITINLNDDPHHNFPEALDGLLKLSDLMRSRDLGDLILKFSLETYKAVYRNTQALTTQLTAP